MAVGNFTWFNKALIKIVNGTINMQGTNWKAVICTVSQPLSKTFIGSSGAARYADLTAELPTANGYTNGGLSLSGLSLIASGSSVSFNSSPMSWTITGAGISFRYLAIFDDSATNKDLLCFLDIDTIAAGNITVTAGPLIVTPNPSIVSWSS